MPGVVGAFRLRPDAASWREIDEQVVALDLSRGVYLSLNGSARVLWLGLAEGISIEGMVELLVRAYGIAEAEAQADVSAFVDDLVDRNFIEPLS